MKRLLVPLAVLSVLFMAPATTASAVAAPPSGWVQKNTASFTVWVPTVQWKVTQNKSSVTSVSPNGALVMSFAEAVDLPVKYTVQDISAGIFADRAIDGPKLASYKITKTYPVDTSTPGVERLDIEWSGTRAAGKTPVRGEVIVDVFKVNGAWAFDAYMFSAPKAVWAKSIGTLYTIGSNTTYKG